MALLVSSSAFLLLQGCCTAVKGWKVLKNDGTEILPERRENTPLEAILQPSNSNNNNNNNNSNAMNNRAKNGGRAANAVSYSKYDKDDRANVKYLILQELNGKDQ